MFFYPAVSGPKKRKRQSTADPDSETTSSSDSDSSSTVDTSTSEGEDEKDFILPDYPSDELTSSESSASEPEEAPPRISARAGQSESPGSTHSSTETTSAPKISQTTSTPRALHFPSSSFSSTPIPGGCCAAKQTCEPSRTKPASYYAKNFKPVAVPELKAFLGLRLQMEKCVIKPRYESYWQGAGHKFIAHTPGFREVMERDRFIALWGFLHLVDQTDEAVDKSDKIYKVNPMLDRMLPLFRRYYSPRQQLSLDEGMIPTKNRLAIKQYICDKPVRWGIKSFLLCEAKRGYILDAEIYTGRVRDRHWPRGELAGHQQEPHAVHGLLLQLRRALPPAEERTGSPGRGHRHAKPQALPQGTWQEADRTCLVRIPVPGSSVCHCLEGPQAHPLLEQLPRPQESVHCEQACGGPARAVDRATACGGLHQVS